VSDPGWPAARPGLGICQRPGVLADGPGGRRVGPAADPVVAVPAGGHDGLHARCEPAHRLPRQRARVLCLAADEVSARQFLDPAGQGDATAADGPRCWPGLGRVAVRNDDAGTLQRARGHAFVRRGRRGVVRGRCEPVARAGRFGGLRHAAAVRRPGGRAGARRTVPPRPAAHPGEYLPGRGQPGRDSPPRPAPQRGHHGCGLRGDVARHGRKLLPAAGGRQPEPRPDAARSGDRDRHAFLAGRLSGPVQPRRHRRARGRDRAPAVQPGSRDAGNPRGRARSGARAGGRDGFRSGRVARAARAGAQETR